MRRRLFVAGLGGAAAWPVAARAQQSPTPVIGWLAQVAGDAIPDPFRQGLAEMGFAEGRNVSVQYRSGSSQQITALAADLVLRRPAVVVAAKGTAALAAKSATQTIPIVFLVGKDAVELGLVPSLNPPTSNLTGITVFSDEIAPKRLELLHKLVPGAKSIAPLTGGFGNRLGQSETRQLEAAGRTLGLDILAIANADKDHLGPAFATLVQQRAGAVPVGSASTLNAARDQIIALAARHAIPTFFSIAPQYRKGACRAMGRTGRRVSTKLASTQAVFSGARSQPTSRSSGPLSLYSRSTSRPRRHSA
jgi:putative tryptophan/tyrosine transport system substrate-binding protein